MSLLNNWTFSLTIRSMALAVTLLLLARLRTGGGKLASEENLINKVMTRF